MSNQQRMNRSSLYLAAACVVACGSLLVVAAPRDDRPARAQQQRGARPAGARQGGGVPFFRLLRDLGLSDEQQQEVRAVFQEARQKREAVMAEHKEELDKINAEIRKLVQRRRELMAGAPDREQILKQINDVLTPEQQAELQQKLKALRDRAAQDRPGALGDPAGRRRPGGRVVPPEAGITNDQG